VQVLLGAGKGLHVNAQRFREASEVFAVFSFACSSCRLRSCLAANRPSSSATRF
jgi:hypothetical protein